jgi:hypothetical protein
VAPEGTGGGGHRNADGTAPGGDQPGHRKGSGLVHCQEKWEETPPKKRGREPQLGQPNEPVTFYAGMVEHPAYDL